MPTPSQAPAGLTTYVRLAARTSPGALAGQTPSRVARERTPSRAWAALISSSLVESRVQNLKTARSPTPQTTTPTAGTVPTPCTAATALAGLTAYSGRTATTTSRPTWLPCLARCDIDQGDSQLWCRAGHGAVRRGRR